MTRSAMRRLATGSTCLVTLLAVSLAARGDDALLAARRLWLAGKYAEAEASFSALVAEQPLAAARGIARCQEAVGKSDAALATLAAAISAHPPAAELQAERARLAFDRGDYPQADEALTAALAADKSHVLARWIEAERLRVAGKLTEAEAAYDRLVRDPPASAAQDPEALRWLGLAQAQLARWRRNSDDFSFLVNELFPAALGLEPEYWPAHLEAGRMYLEKYNQADASKEFKAALALNPNAAEVYVALAELDLQNYDLDDARRALAEAREIDRQLVAERLVQADSHLMNFELAEAVRVLEAARDLCPVREEVLGRLAGAYAVIDGLKPDLSQTRAGKLMAAAEARNPHCGEFYRALAGALDHTRKFPYAAQYYRLAVERMPQLVAPRGELGLMCMRLGDEAEARKLLETSFEIDPFNARVSNSLKVLEVLEGYAVLETEHFIIRFDRGHDELLARYAARYLEQHVYPELTRKFGYQPPGKSLFEIFNRARNTGGHGWFSARMVGLPYVGTVGACAGKMVALASPNDMKEPYNWARVLKHEFVHVLNLQQSNFNIPHWYTEALAVESEGYPRPQSWNEMLAERVPKGEMFNLDTINLGFVRPKSSTDWQMAYCQAQLYAQYMVAAYGDDALARLLAAYGDNLDTRAALRRCFDVDQEAFERGYLEFVQKIVAGLKVAAKPAPLKISELLRAHDERPGDLDVTARLAQAYFEREEYPQARKLAGEVLAKSAGHASATVVLARVRLVVGETDEAEKLLQAAYDAGSRDDRLVNLLAGLRLKREDFAGAADVYRQAAENHPDDVQWTKALARIYIKSGDETRLPLVLEKLAAADADDFLVRKKLAQLAQKAANSAAAARWASEAMQINVMDADVHRLLAQALVGRGDYRAAVEEFDVAITLNPQEPGTRMALADACLQAKDEARARRALEDLLKLQPDYPGAAQLLESLQP